MLSTIKMSNIKLNFERIEKLTRTDGLSDFVAVLKASAIRSDTNSPEKEINTFELLKIFLQKILNAVDELATEIKRDDTILISVKNQKLLRTCFQLITSLGLSKCLLPGLGISLTKRCSTAMILPTLNLSDEEKYEMLIDCAMFLARSYNIPVLKNIILTLHLSDYLAALIQLSFAPLKKPGTYNNFVMTQELYEKLNRDRQHFLQIYNQLVTNCFQPILMKELLVLQSATDPSPPNFVKRVVAKELSLRLLAPGGLLSLIRCFIESYDIDTGFEWNKIDMICRIVTVVHGHQSERDYLMNICSQLKQILHLKNTHYLATAVACVLSLNDKYSTTDCVKVLVTEIFQSFAWDYLTTFCKLPGTLILSPQDVEHKVNVLHACVCTTKLEWSVELLKPNLYTLFLIGIKCTKNEETKIKLKDIILKTLEKLKKSEFISVIKMFLFGTANRNDTNILIEEYDAGVAVKSVKPGENHSNENVLLYFLHLFKAITENMIVRHIFEASLSILIELSIQRKERGNKDMLLTEDDPVLLDDIDKKYAIILQLLSEIATSPKIISCLKTDPTIVYSFVEHFIRNQNVNNNDECTTIALVLLNTVLSNSSEPKDVDEKFKELIPLLRKMSEDELSMNNILCKEALSLIRSEAPRKVETACEKAISDTFDDLLPVRAHGMIELTKLIDAGDAETVSKKHYIFCIFQEQLKDSDSYIYLSAINGLASLCTHCTEDVLNVLCKEFLDVSIDNDNLDTKESLNEVVELRMKTGDVIVKVTRGLGEMAIVHKTVLLNTMLCGCRDEDPLIRTSALSNLAEISLVLNYRIGTIIYEVLLCIWSIIETDKAVECRRAAVMVISSLIKGLGKETLLELKENLLPLYRTLKNLYRDDNEDSVVRLHAQIALEELNDVVTKFLFPEVEMEKQIFVLDQPQDVFK